MLLFVNVLFNSFISYEEKLNDSSAPDKYSSQVKSSTLINICPISALNPIVVLPFETSAVNTLIALALST